MSARSSACGDLGRWAIRLLLAYALLIQGFAGPVAGTLHTLAAESLEGGQAMCLPSRQVDAHQGDARQVGVEQVGANSGDAQDAPEPQRARHDLLCCLVGCAANAAVGLEPHAAGFARPEPVVRVVVRSVAGLSTLPVTKARGCEARGPPGIA